MGRTGWSRAGEGGDAAPLPAAVNPGASGGDPSPQPQLALELGEEELELTLTEELVEARLALGQHHQLVGHLEVLVAAQPLRERRWAALMLALYRSGRQVEALRAYQEVLALLGREFGLKPQPQLARLEHEVLLQSAALDWHQPPPPAAEAV